MNIFNNRTKHTYHSILKKWGTFILLRCIMFFDLFGSKISTCVKIIGWYFFRNKKIISVWNEANVQRQSLLKRSTTPSCSGPIPAQKIRGNPVTWAVTTWCPKWIFIISTSFQFVKNYPIKKIRFLSLKVYSVACWQTDTHTDRQTWKWKQRTLFQGFRNFSFNISSKIGPICSRNCHTCLRINWDGKE